MSNPSDIKDRMMSIFVTICLVYFKDKGQTNNNKTYNLWYVVMLQALNTKAFSAQLLMFYMLLDGIFNQTEQVFYLIFMLTILNISSHFTWTFIGNCLSKWMTNPVAEKH
jgi:threonine/homoserine/homoserine lactone efflux protein